MKPSKCLLILLTIMTILSPLTAFAAGTETAASPNPAAGTELKLCRIGWRYKIVEGVLYKRMYHFARQEWIGSWVVCR